MTGVPAPPGSTASDRLHHVGQVGEWSVTDPNCSRLTGRLFGPLDDGPPARVAVATGPAMTPFTTDDPDRLDDAARMLAELADWLRAQQDPATLPDDPGAEP